MRQRLLTVLAGSALLLSGVALLGPSAGAKVECTIKGTAANDTLQGTTRDDVICGRAGQDQLFGEEGNDYVLGGQGDDDLFGDDGNDTLKTRDHVAANDEANGGPATDTCVIDAGDTANSCEQ